MKKINIAIDGPAASGKTAAAMLLAKKINYLFFDTGIIYRGFTSFCLQKKFDLNNTDLIIKALSLFDIKWIDNAILFNDQPYQPAIYDEIVTKNVPIIAKIANVRAYFNRKIQAIVQNKGFIVVGRDITSVVLVDAEIKVFLTSSLKERSIRRWKQMNATGNNITLDEVYEQMVSRDHADKTRQIGKLVVVSDAIILDNSNYDLETTVTKLLAIYNQLRNNKETTNE